AAVSPATPAPGAPAVLRVRLSTPAVVTVTVQAPAEPPQAVGPIVLDDGDQSLHLPASSSPGDVNVTLAADGGAGRNAVVPLAYRVAAPVAARPSRTEAAADDPGVATRPPRPIGRAPWVGMALLAFVLVPLVGVIA